MRQKGLYPLMIKIEHLVKNYGTTCAVDDISFEVGEGEIVGLLGPNGAGKSTTMNILTGYLSSTSGKACIAGIDILSDPIGAKKLIGYLPEQPPLYLDMTVWEYLNFAFDLKCCKLDRRAHIDAICETVKISDMYHKVIRTLSKGYRQRVGIAQALIGNPKVIIFDEPTVGLDPKQIIEIRNLIRSLGKSHTVILSTHILSEVEMICNKVIIIDQGEIKAADTPENLTRGLRAAGRVSIEFKGDLDTVVQELEAFAPVKKVIVEETQPGDWHRLLIRAEPGTDTREKAAAIIAAHGYATRHIYRHIPSLEDVFVEMTRRD